MHDNHTDWPIDLDIFWQPITPEQPVGAWLRYDDVYDHLREARREDDPHLAQGIWRSELKRASWQTVSTIGVDALARRTKDLQIAVWLVEAWLHMHGLSGVIAGLHLINGLCRHFWPSLYPELTGDLAARTAPLRWMNERLALQLKCIPLTHPPAGGPPPMCLQSWEQLARQAQLAQQRPHAHTDSGQYPTRDQLHESVVLTPAHFAESLKLALLNCLTAFDELNDTLQRCCGEQAPGLLQFRGVLTEIQGVVQLAYPIQLPEPPPAPAVSVPIEEGGAQSPDSALVGGRHDAYRQLAEIADYLMTVEPHSPTPYLIRRAVRWGSMPLHTLLQELVNSTSDLQAIYSLLGMNQQGEHGHVYD